MATAMAIFGTVVILRLFHSFLVGFLPRLLSRPTLQEKKLASQVKEQKSQLYLIDAQNEFAKYAKLQRGIQKQQDILKSRANERQKQGLKIKGTLWIFSMLLSVICHLSLFWFYRQIPVAKLPSDWLYPLNAIIKFPTNIDGAIGLPCWLFISNSIILLVQSF